MRKYFRDKRYTFSFHLNADRAVLDILNQLENTRDSIWLTENRLDQMRAAGTIDSEEGQMNVTFLEIFENDRRNLELALEIKKSHLKKFNTRFWRTARWFRDWFY